MTQARLMRCASGPSRLSCMETYWGWCLPELGLVFQDEAGVADAQCIGALLLPLHGGKAQPQFLSSGGTGCAARNAESAFRVPWLFSNPILMSGDDAGEVDARCLGPPPCWMHSVRLCAATWTWA